MRFLRSSSTAFLFLLASVNQPACRRPFPDTEGREPSILRSKPIPFHSTNKSAEPYLHTDPAGIVWMSWLETRGETAYLRYSKLSDSGWMPSRTVDSSLQWFVNWADYPQLASDGKGGLIACAMARSGRGKYAYDIHLYRSANGTDWKGPFKAHDDGREAEHGFVSFAHWNGRFLVAWLDGRHTVGEGDSDSHQGHGGAMSLRAAWTEPDGKASFPGWEVDGRTCDCCQTALAVTASGPVVAFRDRGEDEVRDIAVSLFDGKSWTKPRRIHPDGWRIDGCPVNGPRMDAAGNGLAIAWFTAPENRPAVKVVFSPDGGRSFGGPVSIDEGAPLGRVDLCMADDTSAWVSWMEKDLLKTAYVTPRGRGNPVTVAQSSSNRSSGFPQMTRQGRRLIFAWTDDRAGHSIRTAYVDTDSIPRP
jgi:hypothetical protein